jgi:hypothetical protein
MKLFLIAFVMILAQLAFAGNGYEEVQKLYDSGTKININSLQTVEKGIYVGKCFRGNFPKSSFVAFKNLSQNSGPLPIDPTIAVSWGASDTPEYYEKLDVKHQVIPFLRYLWTYSDDEVLGASINGHEWTYEWKQAAEYLVQENRWYGNPYSYCYYYQFRE